jgi:hypothetical protein
MPAPWARPTIGEQLMSKATAVTTTALGVVTPWSAPVRLLAARGLVSARRRRAAQKASPTVPAAPVRSGGKQRSRLRTVVAIGAIGGLVVATGAAVALRARSSTPPPVAPAPPRVQDVPTADDAGAQNASE